MLQQFTYLALSTLVRFHIVRSVSDIRRKPFGYCRASCNFLYGGSTNDEVNEAYDKSPKSNLCVKCGQTAKPKILEAIVDEFPTVLEIRLEYNEATRERVDMRNLFIPRYLNWTKVRYKFIALVFHEKNPDHFSAVVEINGKPYSHQANGQLKEPLQLPSTPLKEGQAVDLSSLLSLGGNKIISRVYYIREGDQNGDDQEEAEKEGGNCTDSAISIKDPGISSSGIFIFGTFANILQLCLTLRKTA
jgi:hypothetical protein